MNPVTGTLKPSPMRAALGGITLLLLVAVALQGSPGERADAPGQRHGPVVRMLAEAVTRRMDRQVRRQDERPAVAAAHPAVTPDRSALRPIATPDLGVAVRCLSPWLTDLPPPALA
ncbi:MAG TPA: hypothetical protein VD997_17740 [Phycisphaerales bacterium]|nr:hypothetical protein [Phycisphaerales bacterium]